MAQPKKIPENSKYTTPEKAYILGVICGDGYINYKDRYVSLETISVEFIQKFRQSFVNVYGTQYKGSFAPTCNGKYRTTISGREMTRDLRRYLGDSNRTFNWRIPNQILRSNKTCKAAFLKGFFDSEGSVDKKFSLRIHSSNVYGLEQIMSLLKNLSIKSGDIKNGKNCKKIIISGRDNIVGFINLIGTSIPYKYEKMKYLLVRYGLTPP